MGGGMIGGMGMGGMGGMGMSAMGGMAMGGMGGCSGMGIGGIGSIGGIGGMGMGMGIPGMGGATDQLLGEFLGVIRSYDEDKGYGFVASDQLKAQGVTEDAYVHKHYLADFKTGSEVRFTAFLDGRNGRPRAKDLKDATGQVGQQAAAVANRGDQAILGTFVGQIKSYNTTKGFGFISCPALNSQGHTGDVYLHAKHAQSSPYGVGDSVSFTAYLHQGRLQGRDLQDPGASAGGPVAKKMKTEEGSGEAPAGASAMDTGMGGMGGGMCGSLGAGMGGGAGGDAGRDAGGVMSGGPGGMYGGLA